MAAPGVLERARMTAELEAKHRAGLDAALGAGASVLASGGSALDAVEAARAAWKTIRCSTPGMAPC
jgi:beta-aspartyl-peptidase (threonine type)